MGSAVGGAVAAAAAVGAGGVTLGATPTAAGDNSSSGDGSGSGNGGGSGGVGGNDTVLARRSRYMAHIVAARSRAPGRRLFKLCGGQVKPVNGAPTPERTYTWRGVSGLHEFCIRGLRLLSSRQLASLQNKKGRAAKRNAAGERLGWRLV